MKNIIIVIATLIFLSKCNFYVKQDIKKISDETNISKKRIMIFRGTISFLSFLVMPLFWVWINIFGNKIGSIIWLVGSITYLISSGSIYDLDGLFNLKYKNFDVRLLPKEK